MPLYVIQIGSYLHKPLRLYQSYGTRDVSAEEHTGCHLVILLIKGMSGGRSLSYKFIFKKKILKRTRTRPFYGIAIYIYIYIYIYTRTYSFIFSLKMVPKSRNMSL